MSATRHKLRQTNLMISYFSPLIRKFLIVELWTGGMTKNWRGGMTKNINTVNILMAHFEVNAIDPKLLSENFLENEHGRDVEKELFAVEDDDSKRWVGGCFPREVRNI